MSKLTFVNFTTIEYFTSVNLSIFFINFCFVLTDNRAMNTTEQIIKVIEERLEALDMSKAELLRRSGQSQSLFVMALKRGSSFRIESLVEMSKVLNISLPVLLGIDDSLPKDIQFMVDMLMVIPENDRKMIAMNIKNYYDVAMAERSK